MHVRKAAFTSRGIMPKYALQQHHCSMSVACTGLCTHQGRSRKSPDAGSCPGGACRIGTETKVKQRCCCTVDKQRLLCRVACRGSVITEASKYASWHTNPKQTSRRCSCMHHHKQSLTCEARAAELSHAAEGRRLLVDCWHRMWRSKASPCDGCCPCR